jgi:uncharacterized delta-60 repeat protein
MRAAASVVLTIIGLVVVSGAHAGGGGLDSSFGQGGTVSTAFKPSPAFVFSAGTANDVVIQKDGKIVAAGMAWWFGLYSDFAVARYNRDGSLDTTFGDAGQLRTSFDSWPSITRAQAVAVQADGKLVVAGAATGGMFALARYNTDGTLDPSFGADGEVVTPFGDGFASVNALLIQPDRKIIAVGEANGDFALARYNVDGTLDQTFGTTGTVVTDLDGRGSFDEANDAAFAGGGTILAAGTTSRATGRLGDFVVARYKLDGSLDRTFGVDGIATTDVTPAWDIANAVVVQRSGKIVTAGETASFGSGSGFALARYTKSGRLDRTFGLNGLVETPFSGSSAAAAADIAIQKNGELIGAGWRTSNVAGDDFALARYHNNGKLDRTFGNSGTVTTDFGGRHGSEEAAAIAIQPDGRLVVAGFDEDLGSNFALARYLAR